MIRASDRAALHQAAKRRHLLVRFDGDAVLFFRQSHLCVQVVERTPVGWRERDATSKGLELLAELPTIRRAWAWLRGYRIRLQQRKEGAA